MAGSMYHQQWFSAKEFRARHQRVYDAIGTDAVAVVQGMAPVSGFAIPRQTNEFFYLSGVEVAQAYLLLDGRSRSSTLYLPHRDERMAASEGSELAAEDGDLARKLTGFDAVKGPEALQADLKGARIVYTPSSPAEGLMECQDMLRAAARMRASDPWDMGVAREAHFMGLLMMRCNVPDLRNLSPILNTMRAVKSAEELAVLRVAGALSAQAVTEAIKCTKPGLFEFHLGAIAEYVYKVNGAFGASYRAIIASGENIWHAHYFRNNCILKAGELVLMDVAPDFCCYTSDIGRMWPVNGTYTKMQRQLYGFMLKYHQTYLKLLRPGVLPAKVAADAAKQMKTVVEKTKWIKPTYEAAARRTLEFGGHLSHLVGMAVHDVGTYRDEPFKPGCVFALDPQMWVPEEKVYIRIEDTVAITDKGVENLTGEAPHELDEVEALVGKGGMLQKLPPMECGDASPLFPRRA